MKNILIREAQMGELERVAELTREAFKTPYKPGGLVTTANDDPEKLYSEVNRGVRVLVATENDSIIGAQRMEKIDGDIHLFRLAVLPSHRGLGVGRGLMEKAFQIAREENVRKVSIEVAEEKGLIPYYEGFGFKVVERKLVKDHYEVIMEKVLR